MNLHKDDTLEGTQEENEAVKIIRLGKNTKFMVQFLIEDTPEEKIQFTRDFARWVNEPGNQVMLMPDGVRIVMFEPEE